MKLKVGSHKTLIKAMRRVKDDKKSAAAKELLKILLEQRKE